MHTINSGQLACSHEPTHLVTSLPKEEMRWYAVYTCANHEKSVARQLDLLSIETFLPLYERVSRWKDRRIRLQSPLFPGYVFVRIPLLEKLRVLEVPSVARLVGFNGQPTPLPEGELDVLRRGLRAGLYAEACPYLQVGRRVRVRSGPLQGLEGILKKKKTTFRFVISMELIQRSISVEMDAADLDVLPTLRVGIPLS
ncbi:MAG TPA: UpxY family transcription antiterminator [Candidatus Acidoferrales bacterium]|nr:UpxY family transcription antiterminator [Candidatus Acidoferrales bacterium]